MYHTIGIDLNSTSCIREYCLFFNKLYLLVNMKKFYLYCFFLSVFIVFLILFINFIFLTISLFKLFSVDVELFSVFNYNDINGLYINKHNTIYTSNDIGRDYNSLTRQKDESLNFYDRSKRLLFWTLWERYTDKYSSYKEFKKQWDINTGLRKEIKPDLRNEFESVLLFKNVISWLLSRRNPNQDREFKHPKNFTPRFSNINGNFRKKWIMLENTVSFLLLIYNKVLMKNLFERYKLLFVLILISLIMLTYLLLNICFVENLYCQPDNNSPFNDEYWSTKKPLIIDKGVTHKLDVNTSYYSRPLGVTSIDQTSNVTTSTQYEIGQNRPIYEIPSTPSHASYAWSNKALDGYTSDGWSTAAVNSYYSEEFVIPKKGLLGKLKLGFGYIGSKFNNVYIKYHDINKRKIYWNIWEKNRGNYGSYEYFKREWDPETKIWKEIYSKIKKDLRTEIKELLNNKTPFKKSLDQGCKGYIQDFLP